MKACTKVCTKCKTGKSAENIQRLFKGRVKKVSCSSTRLIWSIRKKKKKPRYVWEQMQKLRTDV